MNAIKITVRLDAAQRTAELEIMAAHSRPRVEGLAEVFGRLGLRSLCIVELWTPRYRITRSRLAECDGSALSGARVLQVLNAARDAESGVRRQIGEGLRECLVPTSHRSRAPGAVSEAI